MTFSARLKPLSLALLSLTARPTTAATADAIKIVGAGARLPAPIDLRAELVQ